MGKQKKSKKNKGAKDQAPAAAADAAAEQTPADEAASPDESDVPTPEPSDPWAVSHAIQTSQTNAKAKGSGKRKKLKNKIYEGELARLQIELVKLQEWIKHQGLKVVVIFEGRDAAGKGGTIKRITQSLNPRICRVVA